MFALCLEGEWLDPDRFIAAVARMMDRNPKCASRTVRVPSFLGERFYREPLPDAASRACCFHEPDPALKDRETLEELIQDLMNVRLNMESAPPVVFHWFRLGQGRIVKFYPCGRPTDGIGAICLVTTIPEGAVLSFMGMKGLLERPEMERLTQLVETTLDELASTNAA